MELKIKLHVSFVANNTVYNQQNLIMTIGELKFIFRIYKESSATDIISEKTRKNLPYLTSQIGKQKSFFDGGCVAPTNNLSFFA